MNSIQTRLKKMLPAMFAVFFSLTTFGQTYIKNYETSNEDATSTLHSTKINLVVLGDGYSDDAGLTGQELFNNHVAGVLYGTQCQCLPNGEDYQSLGLFKQFPFEQYRNYFNIYTVFQTGNSFATGVPGAIGLNEPCNATEHVNNCDNCSTELITNDWGTTFDYKARETAPAYHRSVFPRDDTPYGNGVEASQTGATGVINEVTNTIYSAQSYNNLFVMMMANANGRLTGLDRAGSGGMNINGTGIGLTVLSADVKLGGDLAAHEFAHSFALLGDEYWPGYQFAFEADNMTLSTNPSSNEDHPWHIWYGVGSVSNFNHKLPISVCNSSESGTNTDPAWFRPTHNGNCKMQKLESGYCSVCRAGIIETIHDKVPLIKSYTGPANGSDVILTYTSTPITFSFDLQEPNDGSINYNYNQVQWLLDDVEIDLDESDDIDADGYSITLNCSLDEPFDGMTPGGHVLKALVQDKTPDVKPTENQYHLDNHVYEYTWYIKYEPQCCSLPAYTANGPITWDDGDGNGTIGSIPVSGYKISGIPTIAINGTLTLSTDLEIEDCNVLMGEDAEIIVEQGVTFTVDGSRLYNCSDMWEGIKVLGTIDETPTSGYQGKIILEDDSKIENARIGVLLGDCDGWCNGDGGGIIDASNTIFRNCRKSVAFVTYPYYPNLSNFDDVTFLCDQGMLDPSYNGDGVNAFVTAWGTKSITFSDCRFIVDLDDSYDTDGDAGPDGLYKNFDFNKRGVGIGGFDFAVNVKEIDGTSEFVNLHFGIDVSRTFNANFWYRLLAENTTFDNCRVAIQDENTNHDYIGGNTFTVPRISFDPGPEYELPIGILTWNGEYYTVYDNTFAGDLASGIAYGIMNRGFIDGGGLIFDNHFDKLLIADQMERDNPNLELQCNTYAQTTSNGADWVVCPEDPGVLANQGTGILATQERADNVFNNSSNFYDWAERWFYYAPSNANTFPVFAYSQNNSLAIQSGEPSSNCTLPTHGNISARKAVWKNLEDSLTTLTTEYGVVEANLDSGYTDSLIARLANSGYSNSLLADSLIYFSPLTDTVLGEVCERGFNEVQFKNIIVANSPVSAMVWQEVAERMEESAVLPVITEDYQDTIISAQLTDSIRTLSVIGRETQSVETDIFVAINNILYLYVDSDSVNVMIHFLADTLDSTPYKKMAVGASLANDSVSLARAILEDIDLANANDTAFYAFFDIAVDLADDSLNWFEVDMTQKATIQALAAGDYKVSTQAQAVLRLVYDSVYVRRPETMPELRLSGNTPTYQEEEPNEEITRTALQDIQVYPNPFTNSFNVAYQLEYEAGELKLEVFDLLGRNIHTEVHYNNTGGTMTIDMGDCLGVYLLRMTADKKIVYQTKVLCSQN